MKKPGIRNLDLDFIFRLTGAKDFANSFDNAMGKENRRISKQLLVAIIPFVLLTAGALIFNQMILLYVGLGLLMLTTIVCQFLDASKELKDVTPKNDLSEYESGLDDSVDVVLLNDFEEKKASDFYTEDFKKAYEIYNSRHPYINQEKTKLRLVGKKNSVEEKDSPNLNRNEIINQINDAINNLYIVYKLPPLKIETEIWELFLNHLYSFFESRQMISEFQNLVFSFIESCFCKALHKNFSAIKISCFVDNLCFLKNEKISEGDIKILQQDIRCLFNSKQIKNFNNYSLKP